MNDFADAAFSPDGQHRYRLCRRWDRSKPRVLWVMLNPSSANALQDDPTIRRVQRFSVKNGFGALEVVNLFSRISTDPEDLKGLDTAALIGPENAKHWAEAKGRADAVIAAWGAMKVFDEASAKARALQAVAFFEEMMALEILAGGMPKHPLYCEKDSILVTFATKGKVLDGSPLLLDSVDTDSGKIDKHE